MESLIGEDEIRERITHKIRYVLLVCGNPIEGGLSLGAGVIIAESQLVHQIALLLALEAGEHATEHQCCGHQRVCPEVAQMIAP